MTQDSAAALATRSRRSGEEHIAAAEPAGRSRPAEASSDVGIWYGSPDLDRANAMSAASAIGHLGIEFNELGKDYVTARMPVDSRTRQPFGILHGGASVLLAESLVSCAATFVVAPGKSCVGMEINANHLRPVASGWVTGTARPIALGQRSQVWEVRIVDGSDKLVCVSRCTVAVVEAPRRTRYQCGRSSGRTTAVD